MVCKKNDILELDIVDMGNDGEGIGRVNGYALFVKDALTGDRVRVKVMKTRKHFGYAKLLDVLETSPDRVRPACPVAGRCGGCQLQHCSYERQLRYKEEKVRNCLERIGGFRVLLPGSQNVQGEDEEGIRMEPVLSMENPFFYRNKAQFPVGMDGNKHLIAGFYAGRTHQIISNTNCMIQHPCNRAVVETILEFMRVYGILPYDEVNHTGLVRHIVTRVGKKTGEVMICLVLNGSELQHSDVLVEKLLAIRMEEQIKSICINRNQEKTNVILGKEVFCLYGRPYIEDVIGDIRYRISPLSFYQVNQMQTEKLYQTALEYADLQGGEVVWDLYCGIGTISLFMAKKAKKVFGVEIVPQAVEDARENARINQIDNAEFFSGAAEVVVPEIYEQSGGSLKADVVTLDPPRKGCDQKLLDTVIGMEPEKIVYISCDPATLARDLKYLCAGGYGLKRVRACDMFGFSAHVESVIMLQRK